MPASLANVGSLIYFNDAEEAPDPVDFVGQTWDDVKRKISEKNKIR